jgi:hypothetical protein
MTSPLQELRPLLDAFISPSQSEPTRTNAYSRIEAGSYRGVLKALTAYVGN